MTPEISTPRHPLDKVRARYADWQAGDEDALSEADFRDAAKAIRMMRDHWRAVRLRGSYARMYLAAPADRTST